MIMHTRFAERIATVLADARASISADDLVRRVDKLFGKSKLERNEFIKYYLNPELIKRYGNRSE